jgi:hypothetical protein
MKKEYRRTEDGRHETDKEKDVIKNISTLQISMKFFTSMMPTQ